MPSAAQQLAVAASNATGRLLLTTWTADGWRTERRGVRPSHWLPELPHSEHEIWVKECQIRDLLLAISLARSPLGQARGAQVSPVPLLDSGDSGASANLPNNSRRGARTSRGAAHLQDRFSNIGATATHSQEK
jgi:hypothetical protein